MKIQKACQPREGEQEYKERQQAPRGLHTRMLQPMPREGRYALEVLHVLRIYADARSYCSKAEQGTILLRSCRLRLRLSYGLRVLMLLEGP